MHAVPLVPVAHPLVGAPCLFSCSRFSNRVVSTRFLVYPWYPTTLEAWAASRRAGGSGAGAGPDTGASDACGDLSLPNRDGRVVNGATESEWVMLLLQMCEVLVYLWQNWVSHRDIKVGACSSLCVYVCDCVSM